MIYTLLFVTVSYLAVSFYFSLKITLKENNRNYLLLMPFIYASLHIGYGAGSLAGVIKLLLEKLGSVGELGEKKEYIHKKEWKGDLPTVSIIIPCFNENGYIEKCLDSIIANDFPKEKITVLVIDGYSTDGTREKLKAYSEKFSFIRILNNEKKEQQFALNIGIINASSKIIIRMDAHSIYKNNYISECVRALHEYDADNVGGRWIIVPRDDTLIGRAIGFAVSVSFGVGNAYYRLTSLKHKGPALDYPKWDINVAYFCCRKEIFDKTGLFNENLDRSEDIDFRSRLKKCGYKTLFVPSIECYYYMRTKYLKFVYHMFRNGYWVLNPLNYVSRVVFSIRHIIPFIFLTGIFGLAILSFYSSFFKLILILILCGYLTVSCYYSGRIAIRENDYRLIFILPLIFLSLHISYGIGSLFGLIRLVFLRAVIRLKVLKRKEYI
jgi:glycosyltransferase involved in cell wall biosynthesis